MLLLLWWDCKAWRHVTTLLGDDNLSSPSCPHNPKMCQLSRKQQMCQIRHRRSSGDGGACVGVCVSACVPQAGTCVRLVTFCQLHHWFCLGEAGRKDCKWVHVAAAPYNVITVSWATGAWITITWLQRPELWGLVIYPFFSVLPKLWMVTEWMDISQGLSTAVSNFTVPQAH